MIELSHQLNNNTRRIKMRIIKTTMKISVEIQTSSTQYLTENGYIEDFSAVCLLNGCQLVKTPSGEQHKTEQSAIRSLQKLMKEFSESSSE